MRFLESFEYSNRLRFANRLLQVCLILTLLTGLNYLSLNHFSRADITEGNRFALSAETIAYIQQLEEPLDIIVTLPEQGPDAQERALLDYLRALLREYALAARIDGSPSVRVEYIDPFRDRGRAQEIAETYGLKETHAVLVTYKDRRQLVETAELIEFQGPDPIRYTGEAALTSAIVEVQQEDAPVIYFVIGHGETNLLDTDPQSGLSALANELRSLGMQPRPLDLSAGNAVPEDAGLVVVANPKGPFSTADLEKLRLYLSERSGRVLAWLGPQSKHGLDKLFPQWGISLPPQQVVESDSGFIDPNQSIIIRNIVQHPICQSLLDNQTSLLVSECRPVLAIRPTPPDERLQITPLFASSANSWAESNPQSRPFSFDPKLDLKGPVPVAVASQREAASQLGINIPGGKLVVIGSPHIFSNRYVSNLGNSSLLFGVLNWMLDRNRVIPIPPKEVKTYTLQLSESELRKIGLLFLCLPLSVAGFGILVFWIRKY